MNDEKEKGQHVGSVGQEILRGRPGPTQQPYSSCSSRMHGTSSVSRGLQTQHDCDIETKTPCRISPAGSELRRGRLLISASFGFDRKMIRNCIEAVSQHLNCILYTELDLRLVASECGRAILQCTVCGELSASISCLVLRVRTEALGLGYR